MNPEKRDTPAPSSGWEGLRGRASNRNKEAFYKENKTKKVDQCTLL